MQTTAEYSIVFIKKYVIANIFAIFRTIFIDKKTAILYLIAKLNKVIKFYKRVTFSPPSSDPFSFLNNLYNLNMLHEKIEFSSLSKADLVPSILEKKSTQKNPFILVVPGGGYNHYGKKEQDIIAEHWNSLGFSSAVLHYTLEDFSFIKALTDLALAVAFIRKNAQKWNIADDKIFLCGFSAGGHLCASLGAYWKTPLFQNLFLNGETIEQNDIYPNALCLCYPVISTNSRICHKGSVLKLTENLSEAEAEKILNLIEKTKSQKQKINDEPYLKRIKSAFSLEKNVNSNFPKTFMWHTLQDKSVPAENTLRFANALAKAKITFEYHLFTQGEHGLSLAQGTPAECWSQMFVNWIQSIEKQNSNNAN